MTPAQIPATGNTAGPGQLSPAVSLVARRRLLLQSAGPWVIGRCMAPEPGRELAAELLVGAPTPVRPRLLRRRWRGMTLARHRLYKVRR